MILAVIFVCTWIDLSPVQFSRRENEIYNENHFIIYIYVIRERCTRDSVGEKEKTIGKKRKISITAMWNNVNMVITTIPRWMTTILFYSLMASATHLNAMTFVRYLSLSSARSRSLIVICVFLWSLCVYAEIDAETAPIHIWMFFCGLYSQNNWRVYIVNVKRHRYTRHVFVCYSYWLRCALRCAVCRAMMWCDVVFLFDFSFNFSMFAECACIQHKMHVYIVELNWTEPNRTDTLREHTYRWPSREMWKTANKTDIFAIACSQLLFRLRQQQQSASKLQDIFKHEFKPILI